MEKVLPEKAYQAFDALKKHADIVSLSLYSPVDAAKLRMTQEAIFAFQPWTNRIVKALYRTDSNIVDVSVNWLEEQFKYSVRKEMI